MPAQTFEELRDSVLRIESMRASISSIKENFATAYHSYEEAVRIIEEVDRAQAEADKAASELAAATLKPKKIKRTSGVSKAILTMLTDNPTARYTLAGVAGLTALPKGPVALALRRLVKAGTVSRFEADENVWFKLTDLSF